MEENLDSPQQDEQPNAELGPAEPRYQEEASREQQQSIRLVTNAWTRVSYTKAIECDDPASGSVEFIGLYRL